MAIETRVWDVAEHLDTPEAIAAYLQAAFEDGNPALITAVICDVIRAATRLLRLIGKAP
jgi:DNA-binding phage protein